MSYGVTPEGFRRKPVSAILADIEAGMRRELGADIIQTAQSPLGQINGIVAGAADELWQAVESVYRALDPASAEGVALDRIARTRGMARNGATDAVLRARIINAGEVRPTVSVALDAVKSVPGVTFARMDINDGTHATADGVPVGYVALAAIGGKDEQVASALRAHVVPGISTFGNVAVPTVIRGRCRDIRIIRPVEVPITATLTVQRTRDRNGCPPPSAYDLARLVVDTWQAERNNGEAFSFARVRRIVEGLFPSVTVVSMRASRDGQPANYNDNLAVGLFEIAQLTTDTLTVQDAE